jgi:polyisoprenoid-binding protein YceI
MKKVLLAILLAAVMTGVYGLAASITVTGVQNLGSDTAGVSAPDVSISAVTWDLDASDPSKVEEIDMTWDPATTTTIDAGTYTFTVAVDTDTTTYQIESGTVTVPATSTTGASLTTTGAVSATVASVGTTGAITQIDLTVDLEPDVDASTIDTIIVTVQS